MTSEDVIKNGRPTGLLMLFMLGVLATMLPATILQLSGYWIATLLPVGIVGSMLLWLPLSRLARAAELRRQLRELRATIDTPSDYLGLAVSQFALPPETARAVERLRINLTALEDLIGAAKEARGHSLRKRRMDKTDRVLATEFKLRGGPELTTGSVEAEVTPVTMQQLLEVINRDCAIIRDDPTLVREEHLVVL